MKSLLKLLTRLYPSAWRNRYGGEFEAMLEDTPPRTRDTLDIFLGAVKMQMATWTFTRIMLVSSFAGILAAIAISFAVPAHYVSQSLIEVTSHDDIATNDANAAVRRYLIDMKPNAFNRESLAQIIQQQNLYPRERTSMPLDTVISKMQRSIYIKPLERGSVGMKPSESGIMPGFVIMFDYPDPRVAQKANGELVSRFITATLKQTIDSASAGLPQPKLTFKWDAEPSLPQKPIFPKRSFFGAMGLLAGLIGGLMLAMIARFRHNTSTANSYPRSPSNHSL